MNGDEEVDAARGRAEVDEVDEVDLVDPVDVAREDAAREDAREIDRMDRTDKIGNPEPGTRDPEPGL